MTGGTCPSAGTLGTAGTAWRGRLGLTEVKRGQRPSKIPPRSLGLVV